MKNPITITIIAVIVLLAVVGFAITRFNDKKEIVNKNEQIEQKEVMNTTGEPEGSVAQDEAPVSGEKIAVLKTSEGEIKIRLFDSLAPETVENFTTLAGEGKYDGVIFHRVIPDFMIQTGDFQNKDGTGGYSYKGAGTTFGDEFHPDLKNIKGAVSMANKGPGTNGSQFFIVTADAGYPSLDNKHSVFGQVYEGQEIVENISRVETESDGEGSTPVDPPTIDSITIDTIE